MHTRQKAAAARAVSPDITMLGTVDFETKYKHDFIIPTSPPLGPDMVKKPGYLVYNTTDSELVEKLKKFEGIDESIFLTERTISKECRKMVCDCYLSKEDIIRGEIGCNDDCLNRLLMVECGNRCPVGDRCTNRKFQKKEYCKLEVFRTEKKGHGLRTTIPLPSGGFVIEYVGEVLDQIGFLQRTKEYAKEKQEHFYFMALRSDAIIDATRKGNCSRFINHSCDPNCETQKWTVNGELRIGFFCLRDLEAGEEITFDYRFQRYGKKAQKCFCQAEQCRGWIGGEEDEKAPVRLEPWQFVEGAKRLFDDWTALKEAFRIPKTERVEQNKEKEREADTGLNTGSKESTNGRDNDSRYRFNRIRNDRRIQVLDSSSSYNGQYPRPNRSYNHQHNSQYNNNLSKEQRRLMFAERVAQEEKELKLRRMQDQMVALHQSRCANLNLDPATTPIVDPSGIYYLDPKTISWKEINPQDPDIPPELLLLVHASQHPYLPPPQEVFIPEPAEVAFPPWPVGLPPPPPLPPTVLPSGWKMAVDEEGRCYYYDTRTGHTQWDPPSSESNEANRSDSSDSDESDTAEGAEARTADDKAQAIVTAMEKKSRSRARWERRKSSGLVQDRIISPRREDAKPFLSKSAIKARKLQMLQEKLQQLHVDPDEDVTGGQEVSNPTSEDVNSEEKMDELSSNTDIQVKRHPTVKIPGLDLDDTPDINETSSTQLNSISFLSESTSELATSSVEFHHHHHKENIDGTTSPIQSLPSTSVLPVEKHFIKKSSRSSQKHLDKKRAHRKSKSSDKKLVTEKLSDKEQIAKSLKEKKASEEYFRNNIANVIVLYLNPYRKPDCKNGRITKTEDFKHLARKLTHMVTTKEVKHCKNAKTLVVNDSVKHKTKEFVRKYMAKFERDYMPSPDS